MRNFRPNKKNEQMGMRGFAESWFVDPATGLMVPKSHSIDSNTIMLAAIEVFLQRLRTLAPIATTIQQLAVGTGTTAPTNADTALVSSFLAKDFDLWDDSGFLSTPRTTVAQTTFGTGEANAELAEVGVLFNDASLVSRVLFGQGTITGATQANPAVITSVAHGLIDNDRVLIEAVTGMTALNGIYYYVDVLTANTFALYTDTGLSVPIDSTGFSEYVSGGTWTKIKKKTSAVVLVVRYGYSIS